MSNFLPAYVADFKNIKLKLAEDGYPVLPIEFMFNHWSEVSFVKDTLVNGYRLSAVCSQFVYAKTIPMYTETELMYAWQEVCRELADHRLTLGDPWFADNFSIIDKYLHLFVKSDPEPPFDSKVVSFTNSIPAMAEKVSCPHDLCVPLASRSIMGMITHLNDSHYWPREKIADWLDTLPFDLTVKGSE